ncbi:MAG: hypothetical protein AB9Q17_08255 [Candidatus Reddybacter sp.]
MSIKKILLVSPLLLAISGCDQSENMNTEEQYSNCLKSAIAGSTDLSANEIRILCQEASGMKAQETLSLINDKGWKLMIDANGNKAYVSPNSKDYEEVSE